MQPSSLQMLPRASPLAGRLHAGLASSASSIWKPCMLDASCVDTRLRRVACCILSHCMCIFLVSMQVCSKKHLTRHGMHRWTFPSWRKSICCAHMQARITCNSIRRTWQARNPTLHAGILRLQLGICLNCSQQIPSCGDGKFRPPGVGENCLISTPKITFSVPQMLTCLLQCHSEIETRLLPIQ